MLSILVCIALVALIIGSYRDVKTREVPDWLNFSLIFIALGIRAIYAVVGNDYMLFLSGLLGFVAMLVLALIMFYAGQWGGGDSKMLMGMGALIGLDFGFDSMLIAFIVNALMAGAVYGLIWSIIAAIRKRKDFSKEFSGILCTKRFVFCRKIVLVVSLVVLAGLFFVHDSFLRVFLLMLVIILMATQYLVVFVKAVEKSSMLKYVKPEELTEGDWIVNDIKISGKRICGPKDLGIERKQINQLIKLKIKKVLIKVGIPFVPSFLIAFVVMWLYGNVLFFLL